MSSNNYVNYDDNEKCQCITLDEAGNIVGSSDTLFETKRLTAALIKKEFPFLYGIISHLKIKNQTEDTLFFPEVDFEINGYRSICDFTFMKSVDALGIQRFIWMIYDNSIHYKHLISNLNQTKRGKNKTRLSF
ncbi:MAG TPA: hypothetical protein PKD91_03960 [Bacteroidia bacterium]|nr:hypothetical protein [Bacteroidia bacterium]